MALTFLCALGVLLDPWTSKPDLTANAKSSWSLALDVSMGSLQQHVTANMTESVLGAADASGQIPARVLMTDITADNGAAEPEDEVNGTINGQNVLESAKDNDNNRRMFAPLLFVYPTSPVNVGDVWNADVKASAANAPKISYSFTAKSVEQNNGSDVLLVTSTAKEDSPDGQTSTGKWWLSRDGRVLHFRVDIKQWPVVTPDGGIVVDAVITGKNKHLSTELKEVRAMTGDGSGWALRAGFASGESNLR
jgi:hypothetical protein